MKEHSFYSFVRTRNVELGFRFAHYAVGKKKKKASLNHMISSHIISWSTQIFRNLPVPWPFFSFFAFWKPSKGPWMPTHSDPAKCECWEKCRWPNPHFHELSEELLASLQTSGVSAVDGEFMDFAVLVAVHCYLTDTMLHSLEAWYIVLYSTTSMAVSNEVLGVLWLCSKFVGDLCWSFRRWIVPARMRELSSPKSHVKLESQRFEISVTVLAWNSY